MKSSQIVACSNGARSPQESIRTVKTILGFCDVLCSEYGAGEVPLSTFMKWVNDVLTGQSLRTLSIDELSVYLAVVSRRIDASATPLAVQGDVVAVGPVNIEWDDFDTGSIRTYLEKHLPVKPTVFAQMLEEFKTALGRESEKSTELIFTSSLTGKMQIRDAISKMTDEAKERLYIMIAYFGDELEFFPEYLGALARHSELDVKMIVRDPYDGAAGNQDFISQIKRIFSNRDVVRVYSRAYYIGDFYGIGHLHSKMMLSERHLLIGSANLTKTSMRSNEESAVMTNDKGMVEQAFRHFQRIWNSFRPL